MSDQQNKQVFNQGEEEFVELLENPVLFDKRKTLRFVRFLDGLAWSSHWPLGRYAIVREILSFDSANKITMWGFLLAFPMTWFFYHGQTALGAWCYIVSMFTDLFDGWIARYQDDQMLIEWRAQHPDSRSGPKKLTEKEEDALSFWQRMNLKGSTHFGGVFDAFKDKVVYLLALYTTGWNVVDHRLLHAALAIATILTVIRIRRIRDALSLGGKNSAKLPGKIKVCIEVGAIAAINWLPLTWLSFGIRWAQSETLRIYASNILVSISLCFGLVSFAIHLWLGLRTVRVKVKIANTHRKASQSLRK